MGHIFKTLLLITLLLPCICQSQNLWTLGGRAYDFNSQGAVYNPAYTGPPDRTGPYDGGFVDQATAGACFNTQCGDASFNVNPSKVTHVSAFKLTNDVAGTGSPQFASQVWQNNSININNPFDMTFRVFFGCRNISGGDGMIFVLSSTRATPGSSSGGGNLGYVGINNSVGIEFDTYRNAVNNDPVETVSNSTDHVAIVRNGSVAHPAVPSGVFPIGDGPFNFPNAIGGTGDGNIEDCQVHIIRVTWSGSPSNQLTAYFDGTLVIKSTVDVVSTLGTSNAYWGFTSGTQGNANEQWFSYNGTVTPPALPYDCLTGGTDVAGCNQVMPVEYLYFEANAINEKVKLDWATSSEIQNNHFTIFRSIDLINWEEIGKVNGNGNSTTATIYNFTDNDPGYGINYYKLIQTDIDGKMNQTGIVEASIAPLDIIVFPNPASEQVTVSIKDTSGEITVRLYDALGKNVFSETRVQKNEHGGYLISLNGLANGVYVLKVNDENSHYVVPVIVKK